jgi:hypothetical protein
LKLDIYKNQLRDNLIVFRHLSLSDGNWNLIRTRSYWTRCLHIRESDNTWMHCMQHSGR